MAGHNRWKQIKEKKGAIDLKRGRIFSKLLRAIAVSARSEANPQFNPSLKTAIERAREAHVPQENIERAMSQASLEQNLETITIEAYGPGGAAFIIEAVTHNKNRTIQEIKTILKKHGGRLSEPGGTAWVFEMNKTELRPKFEQAVNATDRNKAEELIRDLENHDDVQKIYNNLK